MYFEPAQRWEMLSGALDLRTEARWTAGALAKTSQKNNKMLARETP